MKYQTEASMECVKFVLCKQEHSFMVKLVQTKHIRKLSALSVGQRQKGQPIRPPYALLAKKPE